LSRLPKQHPHRRDHRCMLFPATRSTCTLIMQPRGTEKIASPPSGRLRPIRWPCVTSAMKLGSERVEVVPDGITFPPPQRTRKSARAAVGDVIESSWWAAMYTYGVGAASKSAADERDEPELVRFIARPAPPAAVRGAWPMTCLCGRDEHRRLE
jgi:hypothetical protein